MKIFWTVYGVLLIICFSFILGGVLDYSWKYASRMEELKIREVTALEQISSQLEKIHSDITVLILKDNIRKYRIGKSVYYLEE